MDQNQNRDQNQWNDNYNYNETKQAEEQAAREAAEREQAAREQAAREQAAWAQQHQSPQGGYYDPYLGDAPNPYGYNGQQPMPVRRGNGVAVGGFVLGIIGAVFATIPWALLFILLSA